MPEMLPSHTSKPGCENAGYTHGDKLTDEKRRAVIECLKTAWMGRTPLIAASRR